MHALAADAVEDVERAAFNHEEVKLRIAHVEDDVAVGEALPYDMPPATLHVFDADGRALQRLRESG